MEFIRLHKRRKVVRTRLYEDQDFSRWELELLHTPIVQRLYGLKQLGFADRVYPDAIHSRFNHTLGVMEMVERMARPLIRWLERHANDEFVYSVDDGERIENVSGSDMARSCEDSIPAIRLMALLHDLSHGAFGHTLEDEVSLFYEKHDDPARQIRFFDALTAQLLYLWAIELHAEKPRMEIVERLDRLQVNSAEAIKWAEGIYQRLPAKQGEELGKRLRELEFAMRLLTYLKFVDQYGKDDDRKPKQASMQPKLLLTTVLEKVDASSPQVDLCLYRDTYMLDMVGNTICADVMDYARRDAINAGLKVQFDERLIRYLCLVSTDKHSPTGKPCIRLAIQFFTNKMRHDVLSEMSAVLKARYLIHERVLLHPTKCAAGAMLGTAIQLLGLRHPTQSVQVLGDQEFVQYLSQLSDGLLILCRKAREANGEAAEELLHSLWPADLEKAEVLLACARSIVGTGKVGLFLEKDQLGVIEDRAKAARLLLWRLSSRRYAKLVFRQRAGFRLPGKESDKTIADDYSQADVRYDIERQIEDLCNLPMGSLVIHCPVRKTAMKLANVLVVGKDLDKVSTLRRLTDLTSEALNPYQKEIVAIEDMYKAIWQFHVYVDSASFVKWPVVSWALDKTLGFPSDGLLTEELSVEPISLYSVLVSHFGNEIAPAKLSQIVSRIDHELELTEGKCSTDENELKNQVHRILQEVLTEEDLGRRFTKKEMKNLIYDFTGRQITGKTEIDNFLSDCVPRLNKLPPEKRGNVRQQYRVDLTPMRGKPAYPRHEGSKQIIKALEMVLIEAEKL